MPSDNSIGSAPPTRMLLKIPDAAAVMGVSKSFMYRQLQPLGPIPWVKWGGEMFVRRADLEDFVNGLPHASERRAATLPTASNARRSHDGRGNRKSA
jgi:hypothetical protein